MFIEMENSLLNLNTVSDIKTFKRGKDYIIVFMDGTIEKGVLNYKADESRRNLVFEELRKSLTSNSLNTKIKEM